MPSMYEGASALYYLPSRLDRRSISLFSTSPPTPRVTIYHRLLTSPMRMERHTTPYASPNPMFPAIQDTPRSDGYTAFTHGSEAHAIDVDKYKDRAPDLGYTEDERRLCQSEISYPSAELAYSHGLLSASAVSESRPNLCYQPLRTD